MLSGQLLFNLGELGWVREEAPAGITGHMIWDLLQLDVPPQSSDEITGISQFINRLQYQAKEVQEFIQALNYNSFVNMFTSKRAKVFSRDEFNVRKLLLLATRSGKVGCCCVHMSLITASILLLLKFVLFVVCGVPVSYLVSLPKTDSTFGTGGSPT